MRAVIKTIIFDNLATFRHFERFWPLSLTESRGFSHENRLFYPKTPFILDQNDRFVRKWLSNKDQNDRFVRTRKNPKKSRI